MRQESRYQKISWADSADRCAEVDRDVFERLDGSSRRIHRNDEHSSTQPGDSEGQQDEQPDDGLSGSKHSGHELCGWR